jgi:hypothetical protein
VRRCDLPRVVLQTVASRALENANVTAVQKACCVPAELAAGAAGLDADHAHFVI